MVLYGSLFGYLSILVEQLGKSSGNFYEERANSEELEIAENYRHYYF